MTESSQRPPAGWYPDPSGQFEQRYWDGAVWTAHVVAQGQQQVSPLAPRPPEPVQVSQPEQVQRQVQQQAGIAPFEGGGGTLFDSPVLVVNQKAKLIEVTNEYAVYDANGNQLGWSDDNNGQQRTIIWDEENRIQSIFDNGHEKKY